MINQGLNNESAAVMVVFIVLMFALIGLFVARLQR